MENIKRSMTDEDINNRLARFEDLKGMNVPIDRDKVSQDAMDVIFARTLMPCALLANAS